MTVNNLKAVIEGALHKKMDWESMKMNGNELTGHGKLSELGTIDGYIIEINWSTVKIIT